MPRVCPRCGAVQNGLNWYCQVCGQSFRKSKMQNIVPYDDQTRERLHRKHRNETIIVSMFIVAALLFFVMIAPFCQSTIYVTVTSEHILASVDYVIYVDGEQVAEGTLPAMGSQTWTIPYEFAWMFSGKKDITISATSTGGGLGTQTDSEALLVADGNAYYLTLTI